MAIKKKDINDMQQITPSDTIGEFMEKCNDNFTLLVGCGGGPRGAAGPAGRDGATGKRGNMIHWVGTEGSDSDFDSSEATEDIVGIDVRDGDIVFFSNAFVGYVENVPDEEDERKYVPRITELVGLKGDKGDKGDAGDRASDQFEVINDHILTNYPAYHRLVLKGNNSSFAGPGNYNSLQSTLCVDGGIGFIKTGETTESAAIKMLPVGFSINSENNIYLSSKDKIITIGSDSSNNNLSKEVNVFGDDKITFKIGTGSTNRKIEVDQNGVYLNSKTVHIEQNKIKIQFGNTFPTEIENNKITTGIVEVGGYVKTGEIRALSSNGISIKNDAQQPFEILNIDINRVYSKKKMWCDGKIYSKNEGTSSSIQRVLLDSPKFSIMMWPENAAIPANWLRFSDILISASFQYVAGALPQKPTDGNGNTYFWYMFHGSQDNALIRFNINEAIMVPVEVETDENDENTINNITPIFVPIGGGSNETQATENTNHQQSVDVLAQNSLQQTSNTLNIVGDAVYIGNIVNIIHDLSSSSLSSNAPYKDFIMNILTSKGEIQNMSGKFISTVDEQNNPAFIYTTPEPFQGFIWIFKVE